MHIHTVFILCVCYRHVQIRCTLVKLTPFGPTYILAMNECGNVLREKLTCKLLDFFFIQYMTMREGVGDGIKRVHCC